MDGRTRRARLPPAEDYLSLLSGQAAAHQLAGRFRKAQLEHRKARDLLRASGLAVLDPDNVHVAKDLAKVKKGTPLSPVLLVRGELAAGVALTRGGRIPPHLRQPSPQ